MVQHSAPASPEACQELAVLSSVGLPTETVTSWLKDRPMTLPARKEGIIPGAANMRLPRFTGDRIARQAIMYGRRLQCDSPEGRLMCDEIAPREKIHAALVRVIDGLESSGVVTAEANRRGFRIAQEPIEQFLNYLAA